MTEYVAMVKPPHMPHPFAHSLNSCDLWGGVRHCQDGHRAASHVTLVGGDSEEATSAVVTVLFYP